MSETASGGCACGAVRYEVDLDDRDAYLCHCRMCQRATGSISIAFKNIEKSKRRWLAEPAWYASSPIARRPFCSNCGTALGFEFLDGEHADITVASLDEPGGFHPTHHFGAESMHEEWLSTADLKRKRTDEYQPLVDRWEAAGKSPT